MTPPINYTVIALSSGAGCTVNGMQCLYVNEFNGSNNYKYVKIEDFLRSLV